MHVFHSRVFSRPHALSIIGLLEDYNTKLLNEFSQVKFIQFCHLIYEFVCARIVTYEFGFVLALVLSSNVLDGVSGVGESVALLVARRTNNRKLVGSRSTKVVLTSNRLG